MKSIRAIVLIAAASLSLASCNTTGAGGIPGSPSEVADRTTLDEKVGIAAETIYTGANRAAALAIRTGLVSNTATITRIGQLDLEAKSHLQKVRDAYAAGNATSYDVAFRDLNKTANELLALAK